MECISNFFDEIEEDFEFGKSPPPKRSRTPTKTHKRISRRPLPVINENGGCSPRSDSFTTDDFNSTNDTLSPPFSPVKMHLSPHSMHSPPSIQRGVLALKLFDTPHTPKTLLNKFKRAAGDESEKKKNVPQTRSRNKTKLKEDSRCSSENTVTPPTVERPVIIANINPYTPSPLTHPPGKRNRNEFEKYVCAYLIFELQNHFI